MAAAALRQSNQSVGSDDGSMPGANVSKRANQSATSPSDLVLANSIFRVDIPSVRRICDSQQRQLVQRRLVRLDVQRNDAMAKLGAQAQYSKTRGTGGHNSS